MWPLEVVPLHTLPLSASQAGPPTCPPEGLGCRLRFLFATNEEGEPRRQRPSSTFVSFHFLQGPAVPTDLHPAPLYRAVTPVFLKSSL